MNEFVISQWIFCIVSYYTNYGIHTKNLHCKKEYQGNRWKRRRDNRIHRLLRPVAFRTLQKMVHLKIQYFSFNRILLLVIGLWPYEQSKFTRFQFIFFSAILTSGIIFQVRTEYNNIV